MPKENENNRWIDHILEELHIIRAQHDVHGDKLERILVQLSALKVKAGIWGLLAGAIPVAIAYLFKKF
jgi:hypothetical protein